MIRAIAKYAASVFLFAATFACNAAPQAGTEYQLIKPPQPVAGGGKVEVVEFFSYACSHCAEFEPALQSWLKRKPKDVAYRMVPMGFQAHWKAPARLYHTLDFMGLVEKYHQKIYDTIHKEGKELYTDEAVKAWVRTVGIDGAKFDANYDSFAVNTRLEQGFAMGRAYGVRFTPSLAVNGKYYTGPSMAGGNDPSRFFGVLDQLIDMERRGAK